MPVFDVRVRQGNRVFITPVVATSPVEARIAAQRQGIVIGEPRVRKDLRHGGMTQPERYVFLYQLATMAIARVPLSESLRILRRSHTGRVSAAAAGLEAGVSTGRHLADLIYEDKKNFPGAVGLLVKAGSKGTGGTAEALQKAADFERLIINATTKGVKGIYLALFWLVTATASLFAFPAVLTPYLLESDLFKLSNTPIQWVELDIFSYICGFVLLAMLIFGIGLIFIVRVGQVLFPEFSDRLVLKIPFLKDVVFTRDNFVSFYRFGVMIKAGVSLEEALDVTWRDTRKGTLKDDFGRALNNVKVGKPWAKGFRTVTESDQASLSMATDRERLALILEQLANQNQALYLQRLEVVQPIMSFISALSMLAVYGVIGLYSIIPFSKFIEKMFAGAGF